MNEIPGLKEDLLANAFEALAVGPDAFVEAQEARGQAKLAASELLPADGDWDALEALGFVKGEPVEGDELFVHATLPAGWEKRHTDHLLWTDIVDERGVKRVSVGYKAAFYDRWASISVSSVGGNIAAHLQYDGELKLPENWGVLTQAEKDETMMALEHRLTERKDFYERFAKGHDDEDKWAADVIRIEAALELVKANRV
jgi:hypothetical protein